MKVKDCLTCKENYTGYSKTVNCLLCDENYNNYIPIFEEEDDEE